MQDLSSPYSNSPERRDKPSRRGLSERVIVTMMTLVFGLAMVISLTSAIGANAAPAALKLTYDQCASGIANPFTCTTATGGTNGGWIGSLVGNSNSNYVEGMAVPQRPIFNNIAGGTHTFIWYMSFNNGNAHGYDFITSISQAQQLAIDYAGAAYNIDLCANPPSGFTYAACQAIISGPNHYTVNVPEDPYLSGIGTLTTAVQYRLNSFDARYGHRYIDIYADAPISPTFSFTLRHCPNFSPTGCPLANGLDTTSGQTFIEYTLVFTSAGAANVIIPYAGHLGLSANPLIDGIGWGSYGAGSINGAAWHMKGPTLDGSGGSQDNQVNLQSATLYPFDTVTSKTTLLGGLVHDVVTLTDSLDKNPPLITGTMDYYLCFLNTGGISPTINSGLADGCFSKTGGTSPTTGKSFPAPVYVGRSNVIDTGGKGVGLSTSPNYTITQYGLYCWLTFFNPNTTTSSHPTLPDFNLGLGDTNSGTECFLIQSPTAITLSDFKANATGDGAPIIGFMIAGLLGVLAIAIWRKRKVTNQA